LIRALNCTNRHWTSSTTSSKSWQLSLQSGRCNLDKI
jgi:hypothetical protein